MVFGERAGTRTQDLLINSQKRGGTGMLFLWIFHTLRGRARIEPALIEAIPLELPSQLVDLELELLLDLHSLLLCLERTIGAADLSLCIACKWDCVHRQRAAATSHASLPSQVAHSRNRGSAHMSFGWISRPGARLRYIPATDR